MRRLPEPWAAWGQRARLPVREARGQPSAVWESKEEEPEEPLPTGAWEWMEARAGPAAWEPRAREKVSRQKSEGAGRPEEARREEEGPPELEAGPKYLGEQPERRGPRVTWAPGEAGD